jgi:PIN domain nuclease of toxin-antitoxin system
VKVLLDTHALLWAILAPKSLSNRASLLIEDPDTVPLVSAASAFEIATKVRKGKLPEAVELERDFVEVIDQAGYTMLPIDSATALRAARLVADHRDPFDRIIAAHSIQLDIPVISIDTQLDLFGIRRIW